MTDRQVERLLRAARRAAGGAYCPYSGFSVGAALLDTRGRVWTGANVENASYGLTLCAERNALAVAVAAGARTFVGLAVVGPGRRPTPPCGACRQALAEFCEPAFDIVAGCLDRTDARIRLTLNDLLPCAFGPAHLVRARPAGPRKRKS